MYWFGANKHAPGHQAMLNVKKKKTLYWCHFELNLLFHMHICVSVLDFVNFGGGYTMRLIKSKLCMKLQDLVFHTKPE